MNNTNRAINRIGTLTMGVVLIAIGAGAALAAAVPDWFAAWKSVAGTVGDSADEVISGTTVAGPDETWLLVAIAVACAILIALLLVAVFRQGHGRSAVLVEDKPRRSDGAQTDGAVIVDSRVAEQAIKQALDEHPGLLSSDVTTYSVKGTPVMRITTNVRRGVSPQAVRTFVDDTVAAWDRVLGREVPVLIQINAGITARVATATRVAPGVEN